MLRVDLRPQLRAIGVGVKFLAERERVMVCQEMPKRVEIVYREALDNISFVKKQEWIESGKGVSVARHRDEV